MPTVYQLKSRFQDLLRPVCRRLVEAGATANQVTLAAMVLSAVWGLVLWNTPEGGLVWLLLPIVLLIRMALNAIDGMIAREHDQKSPLGALLNELGDVLSDACLYLPFATLPMLPGTLVIGLIVLGIIGEMTGVISVQIGASRRYDGPMGKSDRAVLFGACGVLIGFGIDNGLAYGFLFAAGFLLATLTVWNRARSGLRELDTK